MSEWISVSERLPYGDVDVLCMTDGHGLVTGFFCDKHKVWALGNNCISWDYIDAFGDDIEVTHWMPLPPPPSTK